MCTCPRYPAAFINTIAEEGTKAEAVEWLQHTWDELMNLESALVKLGFNRDNIRKAIENGSFGKVF